MSYLCPACTVYDWPSSNSNVSINFPCVGQFGTSKLLNILLYRILIRQLICSVSRLTIASGTDSTHDHAYCILKVGRTFYANVMPTVI